MTEASQASCSKRNATYHALASLDLGAAYGFLILFLLIFMIFTNLLFISVTEESFYLCQSESVFCFYDIKLQTRKPRARW